VRAVICIYVFVFTVLNFAERHVRRWRPQQTRNRKMRRCGDSVGRRSAHERRRNRALGRRDGGEDGIRTHETLLGPTPLAGERLRPLGHLSGSRCLKKRRTHINHELARLSYRRDPSVRPWSLAALRRPILADSCRDGVFSGDSALLRAPRVPRNAPAHLIKCEFCGRWPPISCHFCNRRRG
jgi:hypothetical protein